MPRKLILISTLILTLLIGAPPVQAITIDGKEYWTLEETPEEELVKNYFMITALNPNNSTVRVLFNDEAGARWRPWADGKDILKELHLFWWENGPKHDYFVTTDPGFHRVYDYVTEPDENWFSANEEVEISIPKETFEILKTTPLYFFVISDMSSSVGPRDFGNCLSDIENKENYECSVAIGKTGGIIYYPTEVKQALAPEITPDFKSLAIPTSVATSTPETNEPKPVATEKISTNTMRVPEKTTEVANTVSDTTLDINATTSNNVADTIEVPLAAGPEEHQFPWWFIVFIFSGITLVLWWFIPISKRRKDEEEQ